ncbi:MAG: PD40 domain-containing protein [Ignavibacteriae bacterium]|nr:PD40 domain-containing protein [Ignavibacteriota bacterium]
MKAIYIYIFLCIGVLIFNSCGDGIAPATNGVLPKIDTFDCSHPVFLPDGKGPKYPPGISHKLQRRSPDGSKIVYIVNEKRIKILDLKTGIVEMYDPSTMMPSNIGFFGCYDIRWCPYDDNKLCCMFVTGIDTTGNDKFGVYGQNLFILYRKESRLDRINLPYMPKVGPDGLFIFGWMNGSTVAADSLFLGYESKSKLFTGIVVLPENKIVLIPEFEKLRKDGSLSDFLYSPDRKHSAALINGLRVPDFGNVIFIDGTPLRFTDDTLSLLYKLSWSPDGKKLAATVDIDNKYQQVWVLDVTKWLVDKPALASVEKIDFQKRFCMYNLSGFGNICAEFITNTTLAVSCHHDGDLLCPLWEITTDGRMLRQLTHE